MKSAARDIGRKMLGNGQELGGVPVVDQETLPLDGRQLNMYPTRVHSRSSSWSFTGSQRPSASDLGSSLASINPIRSVIREFVPSLDPTSEREVGHSSIITRTNSQISINLSSIGGDESSGVRNTGESAIFRRSPSIFGENSESSSNSGDNNREQPFADLLTAAIPIHNGTTIEDTGGTIELADWVKWIEQNAIFFLLFMLRYAWIQCAELLVILGLFATYFHCNETIKYQVSLKNKRRKLVLLFVIVFLCGNISFVYYVFHAEELYNCLIFMTPMLFLDIWTLLWCICVTDFIVRFVTMILKAMIVLCYTRILPSRKKGKYYMLLEYTSQFYRTVIPTTLWFGFFTNYFDTGLVFAIVVTAVYLMIKGAVILARAKELLRAICSFIKDQTYGTPLKRDDLVERGETVCPICQEDYSEPIMLRCRHVFCESCVLQWFDRERTCPLCRATIASDPKWRDGSTTPWPQLF